MSVRSNKKSNKQKGPGMSGERDMKRVAGGFALAALTSSAIFAVVQLAEPAVAAPAAPLTAAPGPSSATAPSSTEPAESPAPGSKFAVNSRGRTFGSSADGDPDLVRVLSRDGQIGYVYREDLNGPEATSPAEAAEQEEAGRAGRTIPIYDSEGTKVLGSFFVGGLDSTVEGPASPETGGPTTGPTISPTTVPTATATATATPTR